MNLIACLLTLGIAMAPSPRTVFAKTQAPEQARNVALRIEHKGLLERESEAVVDHTVFFVRDGGVKALRAKPGVSVVEDAGAPAIIVTLSWADYDESTYGVSIQTQQPGEAPRVLETFECECINSGLATAVSERLPAALEQLDAPPAEEPTAVVEGAPADPADPEIAPSDATRDDPARPGKPLGGVGIAGLVVAAGGLGMAGFGISRLAVGETRMPDPDGEQFDIIRDLRPPGRAWLGAGLGVTAVGVTMVVIDATLLRKRRGRQVTLTPSLGPMQAGVELRGRF